MATRNIVPRADGEGSLGTSAKAWGCIYADNAIIDGKPVSGMLVGSVQAFAGSTTPNGWLLCDGSAVSRTDYAALYAVIGTTYGSGDGTSTFNLPNLVDKFVEGSATSGTVKSAGVPNITGSFDIRRYGANGGITTVWANGAMKKTETVDPSGPLGVATGSGNLDTITLNASNASSIYGNSTTVQPPAVTMRYIIKY